MSLSATQGREILPPLEEQSSSVTRFGRPALIAWLRIVGVGVRHNVHWNPRQVSSHPQIVYSPQFGRLAQRESAAFTRQRSLVRSQYRPRPGSLVVVGFL